MKFPMQIQFQLHIPLDRMCFMGKYYDMKTNEAFDEHSFTIDLRGLPIKIVYQIAEKLCHEFNQQSVLVINHATNKSVYVQLKK